MGRINSLTELENYKHMFEKKEEAIIPQLNNKANKEDRLKNKRTAFKDRKKFFEDRPKDLSNRSKPQVFRLHTNLCSVRLKDEKFTNMLRTLDSCDDTNIIKAIFSVDGKSYTEQKDIPFEIDEGDSLDINDRHYKIMMTNSVYVENKRIFKCRYWDAVSREFNIRPSNATRVYYVINENEKTILLIDLYHLFASSDYKKNYSSYAANQFCMGLLRDKEIVSSVHTSSL